MKRERLLQIINEEIRSVLNEAAPAPAPSNPDREVETIPTTAPPERKRRGWDKPAPGVKPKPKAKVSIKEADMVAKLVKRFRTAKKNG